MPQNFRPFRLTGVGTTAADIPDGSDFDSFDNITGLHLCNTATSGILVDVFLTDAAIDRGAGDYFTFSVAVASGNFVLGGNQKPAITLYRGFTYVFDQSDSTNAGHQIVFKTAAGGSTYTTGVTTTGTAGSAGAKTEIVVSDTTPATLYYSCSVHGDSMGNNVTIDNAHYIQKQTPIPPGSSLSMDKSIIVQAGERLFVRSSLVSSLDVTVSVIDDIST